MEKELAHYVKKKYKLTEADVDALTDDEYDALCERAIAENERTEADLLKIYAMWKHEQDFIDYLMSRRP